MSAEGPGKQAGDAEGRQDAPDVPPAPREPPGAAGPPEGAPADAPEPAPAGGPGDAPEPAQEGPKEPGKPYIAAVHDVPVVGIVTTSVEAGFGGLVSDAPSPEELRGIFEQFDAEGRGRIDKTQLAAALRHMGKSERQVQMLADSTGAKDFDFDGFREVVSPAAEARPWTTEIVGLDVPNAGKVLDAPVVSHTLAMTDSLLAQPVDAMLRATCGPSVTDEKLEDVFNECFAGRTGALDQRQLAEALRRLWMTEAQIRHILDSVTEGTTLYEFQVLIRGPKYCPRALNSVPLLGPALCTNVMSGLDGDVPDKDLRAAFDHVDRTKLGVLEKVEVGDVLRELGQSEHQVQKFVDAVEADETDFEGFRRLFRDGPEARPVFNGRFPNPAKVYDVPVLGTAVSLTGDIAGDAYAWTFGALARRLSGGASQTALQQEFGSQDQGGSGRITRKQAARALRGLGMSEAIIKKLYDQIESDTVDVEEFERLVGKA